MDSSAIEARGYQPIKEDLNRLNTLKDGADVLREVINMRINGLGSALFQMNVSPDRKNVMQ